VESFRWIERRRANFDFRRGLARKAADPRELRMTAAAETKPAKLEQPTWTEAFAVYLKPRVLIVLFLGFSAGLPLALSGSTLSVWMREAGVDLGTIGLFTLVGAPYTIKFLWAPVVDALDVPVLSAWLGRRRGWLVLSQLLMIAAIVLLALCNPKISPWYLVFGAALLVAAASATQDIVIDAFRIESLDTSEQAAGMASYVAAYRVGMLVSTAGALFVVTGFEDFVFGKDLAWSLGYVTMAAFIGIGIFTALIATEPVRAAALRAEHENQAIQNPLIRVTCAAVGSFSEFLYRDLALVALSFVILYKFCDAFAGAMTAPFVIDLGFSRNDYAAIVKGVGLAATLIGGFAGGFVARAYPLATSLWIGAFLQMASNLVFTGLAFAGHNYWALTAAIIAENFTGAFGTVIFVAYLSALCQSPLHTATQYALLTALSAVGRTFLSSVAGLVAEAIGWAWFFTLSALTALPSLGLLWWLQTRGHFERVGPVKVTGAED
jgi:PAT family beta-lactamase induction signal transducer AmpG